MVEVEKEKYGFKSIVLGDPSVGKEHKKSGIDGGC